MLTIPRQCMKGPVRFTQEEDNYLRKGIEKFGFPLGSNFEVPTLQI